MVACGLAGRLPAAWRAAGPDPAAPAGPAGADAVAGGGVAPGALPPGLAGVGHPSSPSESPEPSESPDRWLAGAGRADRGDGAGWLVAPPATCAGGDAGLLVGRWAAPPRDSPPAAPPTSQRICQVPPRTSVIAWIRNSGVLDSESAWKMCRNTRTSVSP